MKYRKKPVIIEAFQWKNQDRIEWPDWANNDYRISEVNVLNSNQLAISTLEGCMFANLGDWIIKGIKGEIYPCKPDIFAATYDEVGE